MIIMAFSSGRHTDRAGHLPVQPLADVRGMDGLGVADEEEKQQEKSLSQVSGGYCISVTTRLADGEPKRKELSSSIDRNVKCFSACSFVLGVWSIT